MVFSGWIVLLLILNVTLVSAQPFIRYLDRPLLTEKQQHHANALIHDETTAGYWYIEADASLINKKSTSLTLSLPDHSNLLIDQMTYTQSFASMVSGSGKFEPGGDFIVTEHNGMITSRIGNNQYSYMIYPLSGDKHILIQLNVKSSGYTYLTAAPNKRKPTDGPTHQ